MTELVVYLEGKRTKKQEKKFRKKVLESQLVQIVTFFFYIQLNIIKQYNTL